MRPKTDGVSRPNPNVYTARADRVARSLARKSLDALLVSDPANVHYLTGFRGEDSWLLVTRRKAILLTDARFETQLADECPGLEVAIRRPGTGQTIVSMTADIAKKSGCRSIGLEGRSLPLADAEGLREAAKSAEWTASSGIVEEFRSIKDRQEIETMRQAVRIAEKSFAILRATLRGEQTEKELADGLEASVRALGGEQSAFGPICAVGPRAALPHALPTAARVEESPILLVDWGARFDLYNSDLTRVLVTGKPTAKLARVYGVVLEAQKAAIQAIGPGVRTGDVDRIARQVIEDAGYGRYFGHSLGHGLGLQVHEAPGLRPGSDVLLRPGMVVTVEPGIYLPDWGGVRIEDDVVVTKSGYELLSSVGKEFEENCLS